MNNLIDHNGCNGTYESLVTSNQKNLIVLEPNYRGSTGYGDQFFNQIRHRHLYLPGKDILFGVDSLIKDGIC